MPDRQCIEKGTQYTIQIVQILCGVQKKLRNQDNLLQYTMRILPSFLIRHSRQFTKEVISAINKTSSTNFTDISLSHSWKDNKTVIKYLNRANERKDEWRAKLQEKIISLGGNVASPPLSGELEDGVLSEKLILRLAALLHEKQGMEIMGALETRIWFLAIMSKTKLGLGPP